MVIILTLLFVMMIGFVFKFLKDDIAKLPILVYLIWWYVLLIISMLNPHDFNKVTNKVYSLFLLNISMFFIGYVSIFLKRNKSDIKIKFDFQSINKYNHIIQFLIFPFILFYYIKYRHLLGIYGSSFSRTIKFELGYLFNTSYEYIFYTFILQPIVRTSGILFCVKLINKDIKSWVFPIIIINIILNAQTGLGRFIYFEFMIYFIIIYLINMRYSIKSNSISNTRKIVNVFTSLVSVSSMVTAMSITTVLRRGYEVTFSNLVNEGYKVLFQQAIRYFTGPFVSFQYIIENNWIDKLGLFWGRLTLGGVDQVIGYFYRIMNIPYEIANYVIGPITRNSVPIGGGHGINAFFTSLMNYYLDFELSGIIIFPLIYGMLSAYVVVRFIKRQNVSMFMLLLFNTYNSIVSSLRWEYQFLETWIVLIILFLFDLIIEKGEINQVQS